MKATLLILVLLIGNQDPVITGFRRHVPDRPTMGQLFRGWNKTIQDNTVSSLIFHYNGVIAGKWHLSPRYESIEQLKQIIEEKQNEMDN